MTCARFRLRLLSQTTSVHDRYHALHTGVTCGGITLRGCCCLLGFGLNHFAMLEVSRRSFMLAMTVSAPADGPKGPDLMTRSDAVQGILGCGAHTDWGVLTLLVMDSPGLQIRRDDEWQARGVLPVQRQTCLELSEMENSADERRCCGQLSRQDRARDERPCTPQPCTNKSAPLQPVRGLWGQHLHC